MDKLKDFKDQRLKTATFQKSINMNAVNFVAWSNKLHFQYPVKILRVSFPAPGWHALLAQVYYQYEMTGKVAVSFASRANNILLNDSGDPVLPLQFECNPFRGQHFWDVDFDYYPEDDIVFSVIVADRTTTYAADVYFRFGVEFNYKLL